MIDIHTKGKTLYTTVSGTLSNNDVNQQFDRVVKLIEDWDKIRWYYEMNDFHGWNITSFPKDVMDSLRHAARFEKICMVGEEKWQYLMSQVSKVFTSAQIRYFNLEQREEAQRWIEE